MSIEIIIKKVSKLVGANQSGLSFGDVRTQMATDILKSMTTVIERKADHKRPYYALVHVGPDRSTPGGNVIKERIILLDHKPIKYLGTLLFRIDNEHGDATLEWCLPMDIPGLPLEGEKANNSRVIVDSKGLPIINRSSLN